MSLRQFVVFVVAIALEGLFCGVGAVGFYLGVVRQAKCDAADLGQTFGPMDAFGGLLMVGVAVMLIGGCAFSLRHAQQDPRR